MKDIVIIGAGGLAKEIKCLIDVINRHQMQWNIVGFIDGWGKEKGSKVIENIEIIGDFNDLNAIKYEVYATIAIGTPLYIRECAGKIKNNNVKFSNLIHPTAEVHGSVKMGVGNIITFNNFISCDVEIGDFNIFNTFVAVGHDTQIGSFNVFNPRVQISGDVKIGNENFWGLNSSIIQGKSIGNKNKIGGGSLMMKSANEDEFYFGTPARKQN